MSLALDIASQPNPTGDELRARARAIVPELRKLSFEADRLRRLPDESMALVREAGFIRIIQPLSCGGFGLSMRTHLDVVSIVGEGCGATAWVLGVCNAHSWMMGHVNAQAQQDVFGDGPDVLIAASLAPRGKAVRQADGSYIANGVWPFGSGCQHAGWMFLGAEIFDTTGTKIDEADLLVPTGDLQIRDDWFVAGLQGTGSNTLTATDLAVPAHRYLSLAPWIERQLPTFDAGDEEWMIRAQGIPVLALALASGALGAARCALETFKQAVRGKKIAYTSYVSDEWIPTQITLGTADAMIHCVELALYNIADEIDDYARRGESMPLPLRGRIRMECAHSVRMLMEAVDKLFIGSGATGLSLKGPLQRVNRDLRAANMHGFLLLDSCAELYGRILLGKEPNSPIV